jgi:IclR family transcriptional regulator, KDG regulon repressor
VTAKTASDGGPRTAVAPREDTSGRDTLRTLDRGLRVLEVLGASSSGLTFSEVTARVGLTTGTVHRLLQTLVRRGYVEQDKRAKTYRLGLRVLELQAATQVTNRIAAQARPELRNLMLRTGRRVHLAIYRGGDHIVYIDRVDNQESIARFVPIGVSGPVYATSLGKAILAFSAPDVIDEYLADSKREALTEKTITEEAALRKEFEEIRSRGYATEMEESSRGTYCIGAPIYDYTGEVVAAVSIAGTRKDIVTDLEERAATVLEEAAKISRKFGYDN